MSFSYETKLELCRVPFRQDCCARAEAYGILLYCNTFQPGEIRIITANPAFAARLPGLFRKAFHLRFDVFPESTDNLQTELSGSHAPVNLSGNIQEVSGNIQEVSGNVQEVSGNVREVSGKYVFRIVNREKLRKIITALGYEQSPVLHINFALLEEDCCRAAFLRGAFFAGGSVADPFRRYHLDLTTSHAHAARELEVLLRDLGFPPKNFSRNGSCITYFKQSDQIEDFLTFIGAPVASMHVMTAKVEKDLRNSVNRCLNCDTANLDKSVGAAQIQLEAIRKLQEASLLDSLSDKLQVTAARRLEYPELTLSELAETFDPPVTKSCLNHRLRKLMDLSRTL